MKVELDNGNVILYLGDCLEIMPTLEDKSIDLTLADLPYGTTRNKWDSVLPLDKLWKEYRRINKKNAAIVLTAQTPFDKVLGCSNLPMLRYEWIWKKHKGTGHLNANKMPMKNHENCLVFYDCLPTYNPVMTLDTPYKVRRKTKHSSNYNSDLDVVSTINEGYRYPLTVLEFQSDKQKLALHPTQKPVALMEYLIKTYSNSDEWVLDNTTGSGSTGVACITTGRKFIGIEKEEKYFDIAVERCKKALLKRDKDTENAN